MKTPGDELEGHPYRSVFDGKQRTIELQLQVIDWSRFECVGSACGVLSNYCCAPHHQGTFLRRPRGELYVGAEITAREAQVEWLFP
jgi:hypothetical protein